MNEQRRERRQSTTMRTTREEPPTIAAVDDDQLVLCTVARILEQGGFRPLLYDDPVLALEAIPASVDLVLLDRKMPGLTGPEVARVLRHRWRERCPPIVLLSGDVESLSRSDRAVFDLVLAKPLTPSALLSALDGVRERAAAGQ